MAITNGFTAQTTSTTECQVINLRFCEQQQQDPGIDPEAFKFLVIDSLKRITGQSIPSIAAGDILTVTQYARCSLPEGRNFPELSNDDFMGIVLYLLNYKINNP